MIEKICFENSILCGNLTVTEAEGNFSTEKRTSRKLRPLQIFYFVP